MIRFILKVLAVILAIYGIFWLFSFKTYPVSYGVGFDIEYAKYLGLDWKKAYQSMLNDLRPSYIRISAPWNMIEPSKDTFNFADLDYEMSEAAKKNVKVILVVGQKVPHWPECHYPGWVKDDLSFDRKDKLLRYMEATVKRYKNNPALEFWQVENEPYISFNFDFPDCKIFDVNAVAEEIALVKKLDPSHKIIITDSGELSDWYPAAKRGDIFGTTLYRVVRSPNNWVFPYDWLPSSFYKLKAIILGVKYDKFFIAELQAEPWFIKGATEDDLSLIPQTFSLNRFKSNINYAKHLGASRAYLWGAEWWYYMKVKHNDSSYWDYAREVMKK